MSKELNITIRAYLCEDNILKRYIRIEEVSNPHANFIGITTNINETREFDSHRRMHTSKARRIYIIKLYEIDSESIKVIALAAGAIYHLPRTTLINHMKMEEYMKHLYKVQIHQNMCKRNMCVLEKVRLYTVFDIIE
jgi:hypothetical protein